MTTSNPQRGVFVIGASQRVLDEAVAALRDLGYAAQATTDFGSDITGRFDAAAIDMLVFGGRIPADRKAELKDQAAAINPQVIFLDSLAGIPGLIASQVQGTFTADRQDPAHAPAYVPGDRSIRLTLQDPADVKVTVYWRTSIIPPDPQSDSLVLLDDRLAGGGHAIAVPDHVFQPPRRAPNSPNLPQSVFAAVQVDAAIYTFSIAAGNNNREP
jgi:hypothetical protein